MPVRRARGDLLYLAGAATTSQPTVGTDGPVTIVHGTSFCSGDPTTDRAIKTTYEFSSNLEAIAELQQLLHALRERFQ
jgi:hypothetical protein